MAATKMSAIGITEMRGTAGGSTFSRGAGGSYIRNRVKGTNPQTQTQIAQRANFSQQSQAWRALTAAQRAAWNGAAASGQYPNKNLLGDVIQPSGAGLYNALNLVILSAGLTPISEPPLQVGLGYGLLTSFTAVASTGVISLTYSGTLGGDESFIIFASYGVSAGKSEPGPLKKLGNAGFAGATPIVLTTTYAARFGGLIVGTRIFLVGYLVNSVTGESRLAGKVSAIVS